MANPSITICFPIFNEVNFIDRLLESTVDSLPKNKEIFLIDGGSTDGTKERIRYWQEQYAHVKLIDNPDKYVPHGFNKAYKQSKAPFISLMGAHAVYPKNYFTKAIEILENEDADAVGGRLIQNGKTRQGKIIAGCMSSKWGVGNTEFRTSSKKRYVQSVAFAVYKKEVFEKVGLLDEQMIRNQDDELHYRMTKQGLKILMDPQLSCTYYVRDSLSALWKQYFNYGLYKPLVLRKVNGAVQLRHVIPALFALYWAFLIPLMWLSPLFILPAIVYLFFSLFFAVGIGKVNLKGVFTAFACFLVLHLAYGLGFLKGLALKPV
jgi:GT2 family glycosyltransferase